MVLQGRLIDPMKQAQTGYVHSGNPFSEGVRYHSKDAGFMPEKIKGNVLNIARSIQ